MSSVFFNPVKHLGHTTQLTLNKDTSLQTLPLDGKTGSNTDTDPLSDEAKIIGNEFVQFWLYFSILWIC
jgi:hypothetical protein